MAHSHGPPSGADMAQLQAMMEAQMKPKELVSFRAGQLNMSHNGTTVVADKRRGKLSLVLSMEDGLVHVQWVQRPSGQLQETDDIMIPPRSAAFEKVPECKTGRVILLRFKQGGRKRFFWMQEPKDEKSDAKDAEYIKKMNDYIDNPPQPMSDVGAGGGAGGAGGLGALAGMGGLGGLGGADGFDPSMAGLDGMEMDQAALMEMLSQQPAAAARAGAGGAGAGGAGNRSGSGAASAAAASGKTSEAKSGSAASKPSGGARPNPNTANDALMAAMMNAAARDQAETAHGRHSLNDILDTERVLGANLTDDEIQPLLQFLPEGQRTVGEFRAALRSPQFQQTLRGMSGVLNSSNFGPLVASFGLSPMGNIGVTGFMEAIESDAKRRAETAAKAKGAGSGAGSAAAPAPPKPDDKKGAK